MLTVKIIPNDHGNPPGNLADAELHFSGCPSPESVEALLDGQNDTARAVLRGIFEEVAILAGMKLIGFAIWERRGGSGRNVTFPARQYSVNGERRSFALLRPVVDTYAQARVRDLILAAYEKHEIQSAAS